MLIEAPPYYLIDGVSVLRDHADPLQFYYQPLTPSFVTRAEAGAEVPRFSLLKFRSAADEEGYSGGFADFDVHLGMTAARLEEVRDRLRTLAGLSDTPRLAPVPVIDGTVSLLLFGQTTGGGPFVRTVRHAAKPALFGDNIAAFSVELDKRGVRLLEEAMELATSPIGVVYGLDHLALRPAYHVRLNIDWDRTQDFLDTTFGHEGLFTAIQIQEAVERLEEEQAIRFEVDTTIPEDPDDPVTGTFAARRDAAVARARDMITDAFFESSIDPAHRPPDGWDRATEVIKSFAPQRFAPLGVFAYRRTHYTRIDTKRLDVDLSERITVRRTVYPQGHLDGLFRAAGSVHKDRHVKLIDIDDPWYARRRVRVDAQADFDRDPIRSITATLRYDDRPQTVTLNRGAPSAEVRWNAQVVDGRQVMPVELRFTIDLPPASGRPTRLTSEPVEVLGETYGVAPYTLFTLEPLPVLTLPTFPWDRYPTVEVELRYDDPANDVHQHDLVRLTRDRPNAAWERFVVGRPAGPAEARIVYRAADHRDHVTPFAPVLRPQVDVLDPFPARLKVAIVPALDWNLVERAFVDLWYEDPANGIHVTDSIELTQGQAARPFLADRVDPRHSRVFYKVTLLLRDTTVIEGPRSSTVASRIIVATRVRGHRSITLRAPAGFAESGLARIRVEARAGDPLVGLSFAETFEFDAPGATGLFEYDFADPAADGYELRVKRFFTNGLSSVRDWRPFDADDVTV